MDKENASLMTEWNLCSCKKSEVMAFSGPSGTGDRYVKKTKPKRQTSRVFSHICGLYI